MDNGASMNREVSVLATRQQFTLSTECICPPIPSRNYDWQAVDADIEPDYNEELGYYTTCAPVGHGPTETDAINDLLEGMESHADLAALLHHIKRS
jgi:hypothetical protein